MSAPYRNSFVKISENIYVNNGYSGNTDDIIRVTDDAVTRDTEFFGEMQYAGDTIIIFCDDKQLLSKLGGDHDTKTLLFPSKKNYIVSQ